MGAGLILGIVGWLACTAGGALAFAGVGAVRPRLGEQAASGVVSAAGWPVTRSFPTVVIILAAIGAAIAFAPSWDSFVLRTASGTLADRDGRAMRSPTRHR